MLIAIVQLSFDGEPDKVIDHIQLKDRYNVTDHMKDNGYRIIKESGMCIYFRKGRKIRYGYYVRDGKEIDYVRTQLYRYQEFIAKN